MKFEEITLSSFNAIHQYLICGECKFINAPDNINRLRLVVTLDEEINLSDQLSTVEILGVEYDCLSVQLNRNTIIGEIKSITSQVYTKQFKN